MTEPTTSNPGCLRLLAYPVDFTLGLLRAAWTMLTNRKGPR